MFGIADYGAFVIAIIVFLLITPTGKDGIRGGLAAAYLAWLGLRMLSARAGGRPSLHIRAGQYARQALPTGFGVKLALGN